MTIPTPDCEFATIEIRLPLRRVSYIIIMLSTLFAQCNKKSLPLNVGELYYFFLY